MPQPELRIIIHLHQDNFQPGPVGNRIMPAGKDAGMMGWNSESGLDYSNGEYLLGRLG